MCGFRNSLPKVMDTFLIIFQCQFTSIMTSLSCNRATETLGCGRHLLFWFLLFGVGGVIFFHYPASILSLLLVTEYHFSFRQSPDLMLSPHALGNSNLGSKGVHVTQISPIRACQSPDLIIHPNKIRR